ncbi:MAG TPA: hypothetical protein VFE34_14555, partial [Dongiaceae bacterium]|nr:hypothetical protein [Dongiaceae bacterium]
IGDAKLHAVLQLHRLFGGVREIAALEVGLRELEVDVPDAEMLDGLDPGFVVECACLFLGPMIPNDTLDLPGLFACACYPPSTYPGPCIR